jgi:hypothetical protein
MLFDREEQDYLYEVWLPAGVYPLKKDQAVQEKT